MNPPSRAARSFRPADPREYDYAAAQLAARDRAIGDFLNAALRWFNQEPDTALATLAPVWPPPRVAGRRAIVAAYAVQDEDGDWRGEPGLPVEPHWDYPMAHPFEPADRYNPLYGQRLTLRCGQLNDSQRLTPYAARVLTDRTREIAVRITSAVQDVLFGPPITGTPERQEWEDKRERRRQEMRVGQDLTPGRLGYSPDSQGQAAVNTGLSAYVDESLRVSDSLYVLAAVLVADRHADERRSALRGLLASKQLRLHWRDESATRREQIAKAAADLCQSGVIVCGTGMTAGGQARARAKCLQRLLWELSARGVDRVVLESAGPHADLADLRIIDALRVQNAVRAVLRVEHGDPLKEPLLWLPDVAAGAAAMAETGTPRFLQLLGDGFAIERLQI